MGVWGPARAQAHDDIEVFYTNIDSETSYRNSGYGFVYEGTEINKYLPKMSEVLLEVPALPLSHKSLFFLEFDNFSFVVYLC